MINIMYLALFFLLLGYNDKFSTFMNLYPAVYFLYVFSLFAFIGYSIYFTLQDMYLTLCLLEQEDCADEE